MTLLNRLPRRLTTGLTSLAYFLLSVIAHRGYFDYLPDGARRWLEATSGRRHEGVPPGSGSLD